MVRVLKYNEAKIKITQLIREKALRVGDKLMPERELAALLGMSIISVRRALEEFQEAGIVRKVSGVGTFYSGNLELETFKVRVALINIGGYLYPDNHSVFALEEGLKRYQGMYKIFHVKSDVQPEILTELQDYDKIMVTGLLTASWIECLASLGKPLLQIGYSMLRNSLPKVLSDWNDIIQTAFTLFPKVKRNRFAFMIPHPETSGYAIAMRKSIIDCQKQSGTKFDESLIAHIPLETPISAISEFLRVCTGKFDVLVIEQGSYLPFLFSPERDRLKQSVPRLIIAEVPALPNDFHLLKNFHLLTFECNILTRAVELLFNKPFNFFSCGGIDYIKAKKISSFSSADNTSK